MRIPRLVRFAMVASSGDQCSDRVRWGAVTMTLTVTSQVISPPTTPELRVLAPDGDGPWPVVVALHGFGGTGQDMVELGTRLASGWRRRLCADLQHRPQHTGGPDDEPSDDLVVRLPGGSPHRSRVRRRPDPTGHRGRLVARGRFRGPRRPSDPPPTAAPVAAPGKCPDPEVVVALSGCYYEFDGDPVTWFDDLTGWSNKTADVHLVDGDNDATCPAVTDREACHLASYRGLRRRRHPAQLCESRRADLP